MGKVRLFLIGSVAVTMILLGVLIRARGFTEALSLWNVRTYGWTFLDMRTITGAAESYALGFDPAIENPRDPFQRLFNYPKAWYPLLRFPITQDWTNPMALAAIALFLAAVCFFPDRLTWLSAGLSLLALISPAGMLAMGRANTDILVFAAMALSLLLLERHALGALLIILGAIVFKIIPILGAGMFLGTEKRVGLRAVFAAILFTVVYLLLTLKDTVYIFANTQKGPQESYGLAVLPDLLNSLAHDPRVQAGSNAFHQVVAAADGLFKGYPLLPYATAFALLVLFTYLGSTHRVVTMGTQLRNLRAFWLGAGMYVGTFLIGNNWDYRLIFLFFTIPQLLDWASQTQEKRSTRALSISALLLLFWSLWSFLLRAWMSAVLPLGWAYAKVLDEAANWALFSALVFLLAASLPGWIMEYLNSKLARLQTSRVMGKTWPIGAMTVGSILIAVLLLGQNLSAGWRLIDDHEIMWFLRGSDRVSMAELIPRAAGTDIGTDWSTPRFRPSYYVLRLAETWAWGNRPALWHASHILMFAFLLFAVWWASSKRVGFLSAAVVVIYTACFTYWSDIFATLGPSEAYAAVGLALVFLGCTVIDGHARSPAGWLLLLLGTIVAAGAKENFVLLALVVLLVLGYQARKGSAPLIAWLCGLTAVLWCAWVSTVVLLRLGQTGAAVYGSAPGLRGQIEAAARGAGQSAVVPLYVVLGSFVLLALWLRSRHQGMRRVSLVAAVWTVGLIALFLSQFAFYGGQWPTGMRYDFPGMLYLPGLLLLVLWYLRQVGMLAGATSRAGSLLKVATLVVGLVALLSQAGGATVLRQASAANVRRAARFSAALVRLAKVAGNHPDYPVLFQSDDPRDFEALVAYPRFLIAHGATNSMYLLWSTDQQHISDYPEWLSLRLAEYSRAGLPGEYRPLAEVKSQTQDCILVVLAGAPRQPCKVLVDGTWDGY